MSRLVTKPTKWSMCPAKTQISLGIHPVWSESLLWVAKDLSFLHADSEDSDQTGQMPRLSWVFAGRICHFVGFCHEAARMVSCYNWSNDKCNNWLLKWAFEGFQSYQILKKPTNVKESWIVLFLTLKTKYPFEQTLNCYTRGSQAFNLQGSCHIWLMETILSRSFLVRWQSWVCIYS